MRSPFRTSAVALLAVVASAAGSPAQAQLPAAAQVIDRYVDAIGGRAAMQKHEFRSSTVEMAMPAAGMTMTMEVRHMRPNLFVTRTTVPGMGEISTGFDGSVAWAIDPMMGARLLDGEELVQARQQANFDSNMDVARMFPTMEVLERTTVGERPCYRVRMVSEDGNEVRNCFDTETGLLLAGETEQPSPMGPVRAEMFFEDYREVDGVLMAMRTRILSAGQEVVMTIRNVSHERIDRSVFELPPAIRALVR